MLTEHWITLTHTGPGWAWTCRCGDHDGQRSPFPSRVDAVLDAHDHTDQP